MSKPSARDGSVKRPRARSSRPVVEIDAVRNDSATWLTTLRLALPRASSSFSASPVSRRNASRSVSRALLEGLLLGAAQDAGLGFAESVTGVEQEVDVPAVLTRQLVEDPGGHRRLTQLRERVRVRAVSRLAQLLRKARPQLDELVEIGSVELVGGLLEVHDLAHFD